MALTSRDSRRRTVGARRVRALGSTASAVEPSGRLSEQAADASGVGSRRLLELDFGAGAFELGLGLLGVLLRDLLEDGLGRRLDQVLGLLQPEAGEGPDL